MPWPHPIAPTRKTLQGIGLVWRMAGDGVPMYARKLAQRGGRARIDRYWRPYHAELDAVLDARFRALRRGVARQLPLDARGRRRAVRRSRARARGLRAGRPRRLDVRARVHAARRRHAARAWATPSPSTIRTRAWKSSASTAARPNSGTACRLEIKRTLYMDEQTFEPNAGFAP